MADLGANGMSGGLATLAAALTLIALPGNLAVAGGTTQGNPTTVAAQQGSRVVSTLAGTPGTAAQTFVDLEGMLAGVTLSGPATPAARGTFVADSTLSRQTFLDQIGIKAGVVAWSPSTPTATLDLPAGHGALSLLARRGNLSTNETAHSLILVNPNPFTPVLFPHSRNLLIAVSLDILHSRTILESSPPFVPFTHTRTIRAALQGIGHTRTIVPEAVLLQAGLASSGIAQAGGAATITLASTASAVNGAYVGMWVTQGGESGLVTAYNGTTKVATVTPVWITPPTTGTPYAITITKPGTSKVLHPTATVTET